MIRTFFDMILNPIQNNVKSELVLNSKRYNLHIDPILFDRETIKLNSLIMNYYNAEALLFEKGVKQENAPGFLADLLLQYSPISICDNLEKFSQLLTISESDFSVKRWQDFIVTVHTLIDQNVIDVYEGRYFNQVILHHVVPDKGMTQESINNIIEQNKLFPWSWVLVPYQLVLMKHVMQKLQQL